MDTSRALEQDIDLGATEAEDVKGGGIVSASATVGGATLNVDDASASAKTGSTSAGANANGSDWSVGAKRAGTRAGAGGKKPSSKLKRSKR